MKDIDQALYMPDASVIDKNRFRLWTHLSDRSGIYCGRNADRFPK
jgi:hypothetical protein